MTMARPLPSPLRPASFLRNANSSLYHSCRPLPRRLLPISPLTVRRTLATALSNSNTQQNIKKSKAAEPPYDPKLPPTIDHRDRMSNFFIPTGGITAHAEEEDVHALLTRAGFLRQAYSGIFHLLPLGLRVHEKIEKLIDKHMKAIGASKLALSTISSEALWTKSGRLEKGGQELIRFRDRKDTKYLLSPTHEEEITNLVSSMVNSYRQLPLRLYQISRKYRDERRPRAGLLRSKEFTMKDLYTFDCDDATAIKTYNDICDKYCALFEELKIPYIVAEADSGTMGGNLSHEYHIPSPSGEDVVITCTSCSYAANEVCAKSAPPRPYETFELDPQLAVFHGITKDRKTLINAFYPKLREPAADPKRKRIQDAERHLDPREPEGTIHLNEVNPHRIKDLVPDYDPSVQSPLELFKQHFVEYDPKYSQIINIYDYRLSFFPDLNNSFANHSQIATHFSASKDIPTTNIDTSADPVAEPINVLKIFDGDLCPRCSNGSLTITNAIELGHTFHLGTRYTVPLNARASSPAEEDMGKMVPVSMGSHGIGVSRMIAAIAENFRDNKGLMWPRVIAPYEVCIIGTRGEGMEDIYDILTSEDVAGEAVEVENGLGMLDVVLDDRQKSIVWKMNDADLIGYPVVLVMGRAWKQDGQVEVQCRAKGFQGTGKSKIVEVRELRKVVAELLNDM
ncbi:hypothetical protein BGX38DRAFT_1120941 [Terfezia claveryi]|nr:hypothetical protein BGX38DRAFT_1120941 [Terfezia claveryi]